MKRVCDNEIKELKVGMLGLGTVGTGVVSALEKDPNFFKERFGRNVKIVTVCVRDLQKERSGTNLDFNLTDDPDKVIEDPEIDLVIELIGGNDPAKEFVLRSMKNGKHVITANKSLLACHGEEIRDLAKTTKCFIGCEGAVAGGIPIIKVIREGLVANKVASLKGIINGTCNFILTGMREQQVTFKSVLKEAQDKGFAEEDPTFDIDGVDAAHKLTILATLLFGVPLDFDHVSVEGIADVELDDINYAEKLGYRIKHLAVAVDSPSGVELRVHPTLVPTTHMLANIEQEMNAIVLEGDMLGPLLISGAGAGSGPTASSVLADVADCIVGMEAGGLLRSFSSNENKLQKVVVTKLRKIPSAFYFRVNAKNEPGILADVTRVLAAEEISIEAIVQLEEGGTERRVPIAIITERIEEDKANLAAKLMSEMSGITGPVKRFRIEKS